MEVLSSVQYQNKKVTESVYDIGSSAVSSPDLSDDIIFSSNLCFLNVSEALNDFILREIDYAKREFIEEMKRRNASAQLHKSLLRLLESDGLSAIPTIDANEEWDDIEFKSCGDMKKDFENVREKTVKCQSMLFEIDQNYVPIHEKIKKLQAMKDELDTFCDNYKIKQSQLKRVLERIGKHIKDNKATKESTNEAIFALKQQQNAMIAKIAQKKTQIEEKMKENKETEKNEKYCQYVRGLNDFLNGLKRMKESSHSKIKHLDAVCQHFIEQRAVINAEIRKLKESAIEKVKKMRQKIVKMSQKKSIKMQCEVKFEKSEHHNMTMIDLLHQREKFMARVYTKMHNLENRALTSSSTDYLHSLTEIGELKIIFGNDKLSYFFTKFVSVCNEVFNDLCLAYQAILEYTAEMKSPIITDLLGMKLINSVLKNECKRTDLEQVVDFVQSLPDREVVTMQVARYLALSLPFRSFVLTANSLIKIDGFAMNKVREWMGSILQIYGKNGFNSVSIALENDVVAQVRPTNAAKLILNSVYGLHVN